MKMRERINQERACRNAHHAERDCYHVSPPCLDVPRPMSSQLHDQQSMRWSIRKALKEDKKSLSVCWDFLIDILQTLYAFGSSLSL
jgi:hypothetical protein